MPYNREVQLRYYQKHKEERQEYRRKHYKETREESISKASDYNKKHKEDVVRRRKGYYIKKKEWLNNYKVEKGCAMCGIKEPYYILEFHHRNPNEKEYKVSSMSSQGQKRIEDELAKCDVLCANCHRIVHFMEEENE